MGYFGVVVNQPVGHFAVDSVVDKARQVGEQQLFVVIGEVFLMWCD